MNSDECFSLLIKARQKVEAAINIIHTICSDFEVPVGLLDAIDSLDMEIGRAYVEKEAEKEKDEKKISTGMITPEREDGLIEYRVPQHEMLQAVVEYLRRKHNIEGGCFHVCLLGENGGNPRVEVCAAFQGTQVVVEGEEESGGE